MAEQPSKTILVLGASFVGLNVTHRLLKKTLSTETDHKIVLVGPSTHQYWNPASVRAIVPGQIKDEDIFADIRPGFKQYPASKFEFIIGLATKLSPETKTVTIKPTEGAEIQQKYDILIITTGSRSAAPGPWKSSLKGYEESLKSLHDTQEAVAKAKTIVIGGGGASGVETAGEIKFEFGAKKEVTLITGGKQLISATAPVSVQKAAANELKKLNVPVIFDTRIESTQVLPSGQTELTLSTSEKKVVDLYLSTLGVIQNTEFVPKELLNEKGEVLVDEFFKVKGAEDIFSAGDAADTQPNQLAYAQSQIPVLAENVDHYIKGQTLKAYKPGGPLIVVTVGRSKGTGHISGYKVPSFFVWLIKGRTIFLQNLKPLVEGKA